MGRFLYMMYKGPLTFVLITGKEKHLISKPRAESPANLDLPKRYMFQKTVYIYCFKNGHFFFPCKETLPRWQLSSQASPHTQPITYLPNLQSITTEPDQPCHSVAMGKSGQFLQGTWILVAKKNGQWEEVKSLLHLKRQYSSPV